ncbi:TRAM domain-containing protein, partial [Nevskia sp.]|uniref:TRAM domain-containing protein n=1 Tax=Nevskia sp. TaxID=1929292 RepID=UPI0025EB9624
MSRKRKPLPDTEFSATVTDLDHDGRGVARVDGKVTFIFGALPGETVRYKLLRVTRALDEAEVTAIDVPSP